MGEPKAMVELAGRPLVARIVAHRRLRRARAGRGRQARLAAAEARLPGAQRADRAAPPLTGLVTALRRERGPRGGRDRVRHAAGAGEAAHLARAARGGGRGVRGRRPARAAARPLLARRSASGSPRRSAKGASMRDAVAALDPSSSARTELARFGDPRADRLQRQLPRGPGDGRATARTAPAAAAEPTRPSGPGRLTLDAGVVVGHVGLGRAPRAPISTLPSGQWTWRLPGAIGATGRPASSPFSERSHRVAVAEPEPLGVGGADQHRLADGAGDRVALLLDHRVELLAAAGREVSARRRGPVGDRHGRERARPSAVGKRPVRARSGPPY